MKILSPILTMFCLVLFPMLLIHDNISAQNWEPVYFSETANYTQDGQDIESFLYLYPFTTSADTAIGRFLPNLGAETPCASGSLAGCVNSNSCTVATMPFLQEFALFMPGGVVEFQNPDTFRIHCYAHPGESWTFKTDDMGNPVIAEVTDKYEGMVLGQSDSIKVVSVEDGTTFHLSKHHGITLWSEAGTDYVLNAIPARNLGGNALSNSQIFDFNPGDVFVYLHMEEQGNNDGSDSYELGNKSIVRHDVMDVAELENVLFISMQTTRYRETYSDFNGNLTEESTAESFISLLEIPLTDECHIYRWPLGRLMPGRIPLQIHALHQDLGLSESSCNILSEEPVECTESELLGGTEPTPYFTTLTEGVFGNRPFLSGSVDLYDGPGLDSENSPEDVLNHDPREFYEWETMVRCGYQFSESPVYIESGETLLSDLNSTLTFGNTELYALGEGLGVVAYDREIIGLGKWCFDRSVMIGYQKVGEEAFGFIPDTLELLALSAGVNQVASPLSIFPNPATTTVNLNLHGAVLTQATLHDMQGRKVLDAKLLHSEPTLDVSALPKGMYIIIAIGGNGNVYTKKLVVE